MDYFSIRTATIRAGTELPFDIYVLFQDSYLKYRAASQSFEAEVLQRFKDKKVKKLFINPAEEPKYLKYLDQALDQLQEGKLNVNEKAEFAQDTLKQEAENIDKSLESEEAYRDSESRIHKVVDFMLNEPKALAGMLSSAGLSLDDSAHGSTVSSLALAIGVYSKEVGREELTDMAVSGLLHDTALKKLGFNTQTVLANLSKEEKVNFKKHPTIAVEMVAGKKFITPRVLRIIQDHEEYGEGKGFPNKKWYNKMQPDSRIFNLCDAFDHFCIQSAKSGPECLDGFIGARGDDFDIGLIEILEKQVKG